MSTTLEQSQYGFDRNNRRTWQRRSLTDTQDQHYSYDALSQVSAAARGSLNLNMTAISGTPAVVQSWDYDPTGNWRGYHIAANGTSTLDQHRVHDRGNRMTQIEDSPHNMILDRVGRMRQMSPDAEGNWDGKLEITWDAWSRITSVKNNGAVVGEYSYDGTHRRVTREVDGETLHSYYNDAWRPVEERKDAETTANISYLWGARHRDDLVRRDRAVDGITLNETRYILMDYFNPAAITDAAGEVKERYAFSAFGVRTILNPDFTTRSSSECGMEFAFHGQFLDGESGLMNYGYRYYSPQLGRWTCKDPIGEEGGINLYGFAGNESLNHVDFLGLERFRHAIDWGTQTAPIPTQWGTDVINLLFSNAFKSFQKNPPEVPGLFQVTPNSAVGLTVEGFDVEVSANGTGGGEFDGACNMEIKHLSISITRYVPAPGVPIDNQIAPGFSPRFLYPHSFRRRMPASEAIIIGEHEAAHAVHVVATVINLASHLTRSRCCSARELTCDQKSRKLKEYILNVFRNEVAAAAAALHAIQQSTEGGLAGVATAREAAMQRARQPVNDWSCDNLI